MAGLGSQIWPKTQLKGLWLPFGAVFKQRKSLPKANKSLPRFWRIRWTSADRPLRRCKLGSGRCLQSRFCLSFSLLIKLNLSFSSGRRTTRTASTTWPRYSNGRAADSLSRRRTPFSSWNSSLRTRCGSRTTIELLLTEPAKQLLVKNVNSPYNGLRGLRVLRTLGVCGPLGINHSKKGLAKASWLLWQISAGGWKNSQWGECWCCEWWEFHDLHQLAPQRISF